MKEFTLINICNTKKIKSFADNPTWECIKLIPYYEDTYMCFSTNKDYSFKELIDLFIYGNSNEQIGSISLIAENFSHNLYSYLLNHIESIPYVKIRFLLDCVIGNYLPLVLPKENLMEYIFDKEYSNDVWVNILMLIRDYIKKSPD